MGFLSNAINGITTTSTVSSAQSTSNPKKTKKGNINFPVTNLINMSAGMRFEKDNNDGSKTITQYDEKGETYTKKTFSEDGGRMISYKKYDAFTNKLLKDADYDFLTGKVYQESEYFDNGRIDKHYDENGFYSGKNEVSFEKDGSVRIDNYDENNKYTGSKIQSKIQNKKSTIIELDENGNVTSRREDKFGISIGEKLIRM